MKDVDSSFDVDEFIKKQKVPSMYKNSQDMLDKTVTMGKVEVAVKVRLLNLLNMPCHHSKNLNIVRKYICKYFLTS